jgi:hypothetical protein
VHHQLSKPECGFGESEDPWQFYVEGKVLVRMTEQDFLLRAPKVGSFLYTELKRWIFGE